MAATATVDYFYPDCLASNTEDGRQYFVAYWFENLARHLLVAKRLSPEEWLKSSGHFDIDHEELRTYIEIKASSNMDQLKLFESQLDAQMEELGFPVDDGFVLIFSYINREGRNGVNNRKRLLSNGPRTHAELSEFLAKQTNIAYAIDVRLLKRLRDVNGTVKYSRDKSRERQLISTNRTGLKYLAKNTRDTLTNLGLSSEISRWLPPKAKSIPARIVETEIDDQPVKFKLYILLPNGLKVRLLRQLNGVVKKIET